MNKNPNSNYGSSEDVFNDDTTAIIGDISSAPSSSDSPPFSSSASSSPFVGSSKSSRRPRPKPINLGQLSILKKDSPGASTGSSTGNNGDKDLNFAAADAISVQNYKLDLKDEDIQTLEELGTGAGGSVFRVIHKQANTIMAKKIIHQLDAKISNEILRELQILNKCHSPDIVSLFGAFQHNGQICICMEYMDVGSLEKISKLTGKIHENYLVNISVSVLRGLVYLFENHRIIHRDIKPSNILVNSKGKIKICDFGVSGQLENTMANTFVGTGAYMSPERIQGVKYSSTCDTWSLGLTLLELGLGRYPFHPPGSSQEEVDQLSIFELIQHIIGEAFPELPSSDYSQLFRDFVNTCLTKDPQKRPSPSKLLKDHPIVAHAETMQVDMVLWARSFLDLNEKQKQRWSVTQAQKRQSWLNAMERRKSHAKDLSSNIKEGLAGMTLSSIPASPPMIKKPIRNNKD